MSEVLFATARLLRGMQNIDFSSSSWSHVVYNLKTVKELYLGLEGVAN